jgi:ribose-phosphate pyrophosphokinase
LFSGNSNTPLAEAVANYLGVPLGKAAVKKFNDGEISIQIGQNVRNKEVFILQPTCPSEKQSINDNLMELFLLVRTMKRSSAASVTAVIPYYGYARQDRKTAPRVPISAADVALLLESAGVDRVVTVDLHCGQIQGFFHNAPVDNLYASTMFVPYFAQKDLNNVVIVSPDAGGVDRAKKFLEKLGKEDILGRLAIISKQRAKAGVVDSMNLIGDVQGADAIIVDDLCDTAGTLVQAAQLLKDNGAARVFAAITHPVFSGPALERIRNSVIDEMVIADTIPLKEGAPENIRCISMAPLLGEAISRIYLGESVSDLFQ